ncbi:hypothetical protein BDQ17DRAFT_1435239 [Cyathus striatus]|nr:hypothetical protein BDQ17DRAFT_1435239 [Cyathus striatus]
MESRSTTLKAISSLSEGHRNVTEMDSTSYDIHPKNITENHELNSGGAYETSNSNLRVASPNGDIESSLDPDNGLEEKSDTVDNSIGYTNVEGCTNSDTDIQEHVNVESEAQEETQNTQHPLMEDNVNLDSGVDVLPVSQNAIFGFFRYLISLYTHCLLLTPVLAFIIIIYVTVVHMLGEY